MWEILEVALKVYCVLLLTCLFFSGKPVTTHDYRHMDSDSE